MVDQQRTLLAPSYPDDDGVADAALMQALTRFDAATESESVDAYYEVLSHLARTRLLVPVVAVLGEVEYDESGLARDKSADMAAVLITGADCRRALLGFTSMQTMHAWNPDARPVPVPTAQAALAAVQEQAAAVVVDLAGPVRFVVEDADLRAIAHGWTPVRTDDGWAWVGTGGQSPVDDSSPDPTLG